MIAQWQWTLLQDLNCLSTRYLEPLREESFLSDDDMQQLFGSIQDIIRFQKLFLDGLERSLSSDDDMQVELPSIFVVNYHNLCQLWQLGSASLGFIVDCSNSCIGSTVAHKGHSKKKILFRSYDILFRLYELIFRSYGMFFSFSVHYGPPYGSVITCIHCLGVIMTSCLFCFAQRVYFTDWFNHHDTSVMTVGRYVCGHWASCFSNTLISSSCTVRSARAVHERRNYSLQVQYNNT